MTDLDLRALIEERLNAIPAPAFKHPLGYVTWGADEILAAFDCLCAQQTTMWSKTAAFEEEFARYIGTKHAIMFNSGSSADLVLMLAARELGMLKSDDEILIPAVTWPTQVWSAIEAGFKVKLVDVSLSTLNTNAELLEAAITSKTRAIFLVHLMGNPCDMDSIRELCERRKLLLFEDCCEALGASYDWQKVGRFGVASTFSFFASHHISTMEGGMIVTDDDDLADQCRMMRAHGWARDIKHRQTDVEVLSRYGSIEDPRYLFLGMGFNFRPTELSAAMGSIQLTKLDALNAARNKNAYEVHLRLRVTNEHFIHHLYSIYKAQPAWFALAFVLQEHLPYTRAQVCAYLKTHSIDTRPIVGGNMARHPAFWKYRDLTDRQLLTANAIHDRGFYIGLPPFERDMFAIIGALSGMDAILRAQL